MLPVTKSADGQQQVFIAAVAAQHVFGTHAALFRDGRAQLCLCQIGVQPQAVHLRRHRRRHAGRGRVGVFVGI